MREMSVQNIVRMWDTYLVSYFFVLAVSNRLQSRRRISPRFTLYPTSRQAEGPDAFSDFHLYVCSVFLHKWTDKLREMDFQVSLAFVSRLDVGFEPNQSGF